MKGKKVRKNEEKEGKVKGRREDQDCKVRMGKGRKRNYVKEREKVNEEEKQRKKMLGGKGEWKRKENKR